MEKELQKRVFSSLILIPLSLYFIIKGSAFFTFFLVILFLISSSEWINMAKNSGLKILGILFLIFSFYSTLYLREKSLTFFLFTLLICVSTDIGGYIFGKIFKGPKLTKISPNKTYSGMLGGFLLAIIASYIFTIKYGVTELTNNSYLSDFLLILLVLIISSISQIGDLIISYFKRISKIKNTGKIFPGHGGMLDRIDGMIFVFPILYLLNKF